MTDTRAGDLIAFSTYDRDLDHLINREDQGPDHEFSVFHVEAGPEGFVFDPPSDKRAGGCYANAVDYRFPPGEPAVYLSPGERDFEANAELRMAAGKLYLRMLTSVKNGWVMIEYGRDEHQPAELLRDDHPYEVDPDRAARDPEHASSWNRLRGMLLQHRSDLNYRNTKF